MSAPVEVVVELLASLGEGTNLLGLCETAYGQLLLTFSVAKAADGAGGSGPGDEEFSLHVKAVGEHGTLVPVPDPFESIHGVHALIPGLHPSTVIAMRHDGALLFDMETGARSRMWQGDGQRGYDYCTASPDAVYFWRGCRIRRWNPGGEASQVVYDGGGKRLRLRSMVYHPGLHALLFVTQDGKAVWKLALADGGKDPKLALADGGKVLKLEEGVEPEAAAAAAAAAAADGAAAAAAAADGAATDGAAAAAAADGAAAAAGAMPVLLAGSEAEAGCSLGAALDSRFGSDLCLGGVDGDGNVLIADSHNQRIVLLSADGVVSLLAGAETVERCRGKGKSSAAMKGRFLPTEIFLSANGKVVICDEGSNVLLEMHTALRPPCRAWQLGAATNPLGSRLKQLLLNAERADVHFEVEGELIPGHSQVLCNSNVFFRSLLHPGWLEQYPGGVVKVEHPARIFKAVLSWVYSLDTPPIENSELPALMCAASFYMLPDLHAECLKVACAALSVHNALDWLHFAVQHQEEGFTAAALEFASSNYGLIKARLPEQTSQQLRQLCAAAPEVAEQLINRLGGAAPRRPLRKRGRQEAAA